MNYIETYDVDLAGDYKIQLEMAIDMVKEQHECKWNRFAHTDYKVQYHENDPPMYQRILTDMIMPYLKQYSAQWYCGEVSMHNMWFAEYYDGARFGWHTHEGTNMSGVYAIDLSDPLNSTQLLVNQCNEMQNGQMILFPSMMPHQSPNVEGDDYKLIVGFNWNMYGCTYPVKP